MNKKTPEPQTPKEEPCAACGQMLKDGNKHIVIDGKGTQLVYCEEHEGKGKR